MVEGRARHRLPDVKSQSKSRHGRGPVTACTNASASMDNRRGPTRGFFSLDAAEKPAKPAALKPLLARRLFPHINLGLRMKTIEKP